jgi:beta-glucanase (GH16 family)
MSFRVLSRLVNSTTFDIKSLMGLSLIGIILGCTPKNDPTPATSLDYDLNEQTLIQAGWTKSFEESFDADFSKWNIWEGGAFNNEYQCYTANNSNVEITNGVLKITAVKENITGKTTPFNSTQKSFEFSSARLESKSSYSASVSTPMVRYSARMKLASGYGMWPAFWAYGADWPTNGEIDVIESKGHLPFQYATNYFYGTSAGTNLVSGAEGQVTSTIDLTQYWHVYEVIWEEHQLTYMFDGQIVKTLTSSSTAGQYIDDMFGKTQNIVVNLAVGGDYFQNPDPATIVTGSMQVDWVKVFTK